VSGVKTFQAARAGSPTWFPTPAAASSIVPALPASRYLGKSSGNPFVNIYKYMWAQGDAGMVWDGMQGAGKSESTGVWIGSNLCFKKGKTRSQSKSQWTWWKHFPFNSAFLFLRS